MRAAPVYLILFLLTACSQRVVVDDTPVESLQVGGHITLLRQSAGDFHNPDSASWREAQEYSMELGLAPPVHASINLRHEADKAALPVYLRAATDGERYYLRLRWQDSSDNRSTSRTEFADGAAIQFALEGEASTSFMMGGPGAPVNIWYWKAGQQQAQNLAAGGFGSTTRLPDNNLEVVETYRKNGEWVVVFSRPIQQQGEFQVKLENDSVLLSLAIWQGDDEQRDGLKHVAMGWITAG